MFGNTVPEQFNRFGRLQIFSNKNLISKTFMWFLLTLVSFFYVVSVKPNESYRVVTFFYSTILEHSQLQKFSYYCSLKSGYYKTPFKPL